MSIAFLYISEERYWSLYIFSSSSGSTAAVRSIKKHQTIEMAFTLFPPLGAKVKNQITVPLPCTLSWIEKMDPRNQVKISTPQKNIDVMKGTKVLHLPHHLLEPVYVVYASPQTNLPPQPPLPPKNRCILSKIKLVCLLAFHRMR